MPQRYFVVEKEARYWGGGGGVISVLTLLHSCRVMHLFDNGYARLSSKLFAASHVFFPEKMYETLLPFSTIRDLRLCAIYCLSSTASTHLSRCHAR
jgi:hypothetical protein